MTNVNNSLLPIFSRTPFAFVRGEGAYLYDEDGEAYLDFGAGIAVNAFGHAHPRLVAALKTQAESLWHTSNLYRVPGQEQLADRLTELTFADRVFFCNSGAEALEGAIKFARHYHAAAGAPERYRLITFEGAFHGRTLATIAAGGQAKYLKGFGPPTPGFDQVPFADLDAVKSAIGPETAGILVEPIQGEGGIRDFGNENLRQLRQICDDHGLVLIFDEVQTGVGRTGKLFAYEWAGVAPDIMAIAKALGGGFPVGAILTNEKAITGLVPGTHGTTFGGNPLAMAVGLEAIAIASDPTFLRRVEQMGLVLKQQLAALTDQFPDLFDGIRGRGLMLGLKMKIPNSAFVAALLNEKLLTVPAGDNTVRLLPPLTIGDGEIEDAITRLTAAAEDCLKGNADG